MTNQSDTAGFATSAASAHHSVDGSVHVLALTLPEVVGSAEFDPLNQQVLAELSAAPAGRWVLDLSNTHYAGSALLGMLVNVRQRLISGGGRVILCGLSPRLRHVVQTCSLDRLFTLVRNRTDALRQLDATA